MAKRVSLVLILTVLTTTSAWAAGFGPESLVRLDLNLQADFDRAAALGVQPVFRAGNEFYIVADGALLGRLDSKGLKYQRVDDNPFASGHYYINGKSPFEEVGGLGKIGGKTLDQIGGATLWKTEQSLIQPFGPAGDAPVEITGTKIPLVYMPALQFTGAAITDPDLDSIVVRTLQDSVVTYNTRLMNFNTRYTYSDSNIATQNYLRQKFLSFGYTDVRTDTFWVGSIPIGHNVICTKLGTSESDRVIIVGAHFDSYNGQSDPMVFAPGADDNGSGTAAVLEIARVLASMPTNKTIIFIPFAAEEEGLYGSTYYAGLAAATGMKIEVMLNMDMISYNPDATNNLTLRTSQASDAYADLAVQLATSRTSLLPLKTHSTSGGSDHYPFSQNGFRFIYAEEGDFNTGGWHTNIDLMSRNNAPYLTEVVRMMGMTAYVSAQAPAVVAGVSLFDVGDGHTLQLQWTPASAPNTIGYRVYYGTAPGSYSDTLIISSPSASSASLNGLIEGTTYYAAVTAVNTTGFESIGRTELAMAPNLAPRAPSGMMADIQLGSVVVQWNPNIELDLDHYVLYRGTDSASLAVYIPSVATASYNDIAVTGHTRYFYRTVAADHDGNLSAPSAIVSGIPATFDGGMLIIDLTKGYAGSPTELQQRTTYNKMFAGYPHGYYELNDYAVPVDKSELGQYSAIFWIDDDLIWERWPDDHMAKLNWYLSFGMDVVIAGWQLPSALGSQERLDLFHVSNLTRIDDYDCVGGIGVGGFPTVVLDTAKVYAGMDGTIPQVWTLTPADPSSQVIMKYKSATGNPSYQAMPVAVRRDNGVNKMALIDVPLYFMRDADGTAVVANLATWFGMAPFAMGDINGDGIVNVLDVVTLVNVVFRGVAPPTGYNRADVNGDCIINVLDIVYMIDHVFRGGPAPVPGCVL